jgi:hypothetical protein
VVSSITIVSNRRTGIDLLLGALGYAWGGGFGGHGGGGGWGYGMGGMGGPGGPGGYG